MIIMNVLNKKYATSIETPGKGLKVQKVFTAKWKQYEYDDIDFVVREAKFSEDQGRIQITRQIIAPSFWSQIAVDIAGGGYLRKAGVPTKLHKVPETGIPIWLQRSEKDEDSELGPENNIGNMMNRLAGGWTYWGWKSNYFASEDDARTFYDETRYMLIHQMGSTASPQYFNNGLHWAYGITGAPQGHFYFDPKLQKVVPSTSAYEKPQCHACFILSIEDNLSQEGGIMDFVIREAKIFKFGSGSGANFSKLRAKGEKLSSGGMSSGLMSFLKIFDQVGGSIKSGGSTRRAAKMDVLDENHPEILDFTNWKVKEEDKIVSLIVGSKIVQEWLDKVKKAAELETLPESDRKDFTKNADLASAILDGAKNHIPLAYISRVINLLGQDEVAFDWEVFNSSYNSEAYMTVSGQNANNSISVTDTFMKNVLNNGMLELTGRNDGKILKQIPAKEVFDAICTAGWKCGDPALQFNTTMNERVTCVEKVNATNPCSEFVYKDNTPCNLASLNLCKFYKSEEFNWDKNTAEPIIIDEENHRLDEQELFARFDLDKYIHACEVFTTILEITVEMAQYPSAEIAQGAYFTRTLGLGYANLGGLLMRMCTPYDSPKGRAIAAYLAGLMNVVAYKTSGIIASFLGSFEEYEKKDKVKMLNVLENHVRAIKGGAAEGFSIQPIALNRDILPSQYLDIIDREAAAMLELAYKYGMRNAQVTLLAPTGTIGLVMDCDTTGIEPDYCLVKMKKLAGGGYMKIINGSIYNALRNLGYSKAQIWQIIHHIIGHGNINHAPYINPKSLKQKGITQADIDVINGYIGSDSNICNAFAFYNLSNESLHNLGLTPDSIPSDISLLELLGFTMHEIETANLHACGYQTIEGAPGVKPTDYPIFACATKGGRYGKEFIKPEGHVLMMAEAQSHLSGAISKTVNLPEEATVEDFRNVYIKAWKLGVKAIALFRDGSKLSSAFKSEAVSELDKLVLDAKTHKASVGQQKLPRGTREKMPATRPAYNMKASIGGRPFYWNIGFDKAGDIKEIFITGAESEGSELRSIMSCFAKAISLALQYGAPIEEVIRSFTGAKFEPSGTVRSEDIDGNNIKMIATSPIDYIAQMLAKISKQRHVPFMQNKEDTHSKFYSESFGYTGDYCSNCGSNRMIRDGTCKKCEACGTTTGCG